MRPLHIEDLDNIAIILQNYNMYDQLIVCRDDKLRIEHIYCQEDFTWSILDTYKAMAKEMQEYLNDGARKSFYKVSVEDSENRDLGSIKLSIVIE